MKHTTISLLSGIMTWFAIAVHADSTPDIYDSWVIADQSADHDDTIGDLRWEFVSFDTNGLVSWRWIRNAQPESHNGKFVLEPKGTDHEGHAPRYNITIIPHTMAVRRPLVLKNVTVDSDSRFSKNWTVLKWQSMADVLITFIRERDAEKSINPNDEIK